MAAVEAVVEADQAVPAVAGKVTDEVDVADAGADNSMSPCVVAPRVAVVDTLTVAAAIKAAEATRTEEAAIKAVEATRTEEVAVGVGVVGVVFLDPLTMPRQFMGEFVPSSVMHGLALTLAQRWEISPA
jgi:hypothetical protein